MMTEIGEITVGTFLKRVETDGSPCMTVGKVYRVVEIGKRGILVINDNGKLWFIEPPLYKIVGHIDDDADIIEELDQMLEFCLQYDKLNDYIVEMS